MAAAKKGLGRGFESLIPTDLIDDSFNPNSTFDPTAEEDKALSTQATLSIDSIRANSDQPRKAFDDTALAELAASIKEHGVLQPIIVVEKNGSYEIVAGERRYRASKLAGLTEVPVVVRTMSSQHQLEVSLIENIQRRDLNVIETATAYAKLRDQFGLSNDKIAERVHKSVSAVSNTLRLLKLPQAVLEALAAGTLNEGQARPLIGHSPELIASVLPKIIAEGWSARKVEQYIVNSKKSLGQDSAAPRENVSERHEATIEVLKSRFATKVDIRTNSKGAGKIVIDFKNQDDFDRIQDLLSR